HERHCSQQQDGDSMCVGRNRLQSFLADLVLMFAARGWQPVGPETDRSPCPVDVSASDRISGHTPAATREAAFLRCMTAHARRWKVANSVQVRKPPTRGLAKLKASAWWRTGSKSTKSWLAAEPRGSTA